MELAGTSSWRFAESARDDLPHVALFVRDAVRLPVVPGPAVPPRLAGTVPDHRHLLREEERLGRSGSIGRSPQVVPVADAARRPPPVAQRPRQVRPFAEIRRKGAEIVSVRSTSSALVSTGTARHHRGAPPIGEPRVRRQGVTMLLVLLAGASALIGRAIADGASRLALVLILLAYLVGRTTDGRPGTIAVAAALPAVAVVAVAGRMAWVDGWPIHSAALIIIGGLSWGVASRARTSSQA